MHSNTRLKLCDVNEHLLCALCGGYMIDATTIIECIHSFCRTCIYKYLESSKYCPICDVQIHKTRPLLNVRADKTLQSLIYKLVPSLFKNEMKRRRDFYAAHPNADSDTGLNVYEMRGEVTVPDDMSCSDERISMCIQQCAGLPPYRNEHLCAANNPDREPLNTRYLLCPSSVTIAHIKKLLRLKYDLPPQYRVDIVYSDEGLQDSYTLLDIAHLYSWRRIEPLKLYYIIHDNTIQGLSPPRPNLVKKRSARNNSFVKSIPVRAQTPPAAELPPEGRNDKYCMSSSVIPTVAEENTSRDVTQPVVVDISVDSDSDMTILISDDDLPDDTVKATRLDIDINDNKCAMERVPGLASLDDSGLSMSKSDDGEKSVSAGLSRVPADMIPGDTSRSNLLHNETSMSPVKHKEHIQMNGHKTNGISSIRDVISTPLSCITSKSQSSLTPLATCSRSMHVGSDNCERLVPTTGSTVPTALTDPISIPAAHYTPLHYQILPRLQPKLPDNKHTDLHTASSASHVSGETIVNNLMCSSLPKSHLKRRHSGDKSNSMNSKRLMSNSRAPSEPPSLDIGNDENKIDSHLLAAEELRSNMKNCTTPQSSLS